MVATVLILYYVSKGIIVFSDPGIEAAMKELKHLHEMLVIDPKTPEGLTRDEKKAELQYLIFLKKICGKLKGRGCADGQKQREYMSKDETSAPTVATKYLMLTCVVDAIKEIDVALSDTPGAFM